MPNSDLDTDDATTFVLRLGEALERYGAAATKVEYVMTLCADKLRLEGQFFATPTSIFAAFGSPGHQTVGLIRVTPGNVELGKRSAIDELTVDLLEGRIGPREALARLEQIERTPAQYGPALTTACYALASAAAASVIGGGGREITTAAVVGLATGLLALLAQKRPVLGRIFAPLAATIASASAVAAASYFGPLSTYTVTVSGIVVLLPGLTLTTAMAELAAQHLVAGATRFLGALVTLLSLGLGVGLGQQIADVLPLPAQPSGAPLPTPLWSLVLALAVAPLCYAVLLRARPRDFGWIVAAGVFAFTGGRIGGNLLGPGLGAFFGAFAVGVASNLYSRYLRRPAVVPLVPGLLVLVPGTIGFRSFTSLIERDVITGISTAFTMLIVAISLVAGVLLANVVFPTRPSDASEA